MEEGKVIHFPLTQALKQNSYFPTRAKKQTTCTIQTQNSDKKKKKKKQYTLFSPLHIFNFYRRPKVQLISRSGALLQACGSFLRHKYAGVLQHTSLDCTLRATASVQAVSHLPGKSSALGFLSPKDPLQGKATEEHPRPNPLSVPSDSLGDRCPSSQRSTHLVRQAVLAGAQPDLVHSWGVHHHFSHFS